MMNIFSEGEITLFFAPDAQGRMKSGAPSFFLWAPDQVILFEEPTWFLHKKFVANNSAPSVHTWSAAAHDLKTWFQYLQSSQVDWRYAAESHREAFADDYSQAVSPRTGKEFGDGTINRRLSVVREFYAFAREQGWYSGDVGSSEEIVRTRSVPIDDDALAHIRSPGGHLKQKDTLLKKVRRKDVIRPLQAKELRKLVEFSGPRATDRQGDARRVRDRLILVYCFVINGTNRRCLLS